MKFKYTALALACCITTGAMAADLGNGVEYSGYGRGGATYGYNKDNGVKGGLALGGDLQKFRLGNEGDTGLEVYVGKSFDAGDGVKYKFGYMPNKWNTGTLGTVQAFGEISGLNFSPETKFWVGQRRLRIQDVHIVDHFLMNSGEYQGAGFMDMPVGSVKLSGTLSSADSFDNKVLLGGKANKINLDIANVETNPGGALRFLFTAINSSGFGSNGGGGASVVHNQNDFLTPGLTNSLFLQTSSGLARITGEFLNVSDLQGTSSSATTNANGQTASQVYGVKSSRIVESIAWQKGMFGGQALAGYQTSKSSDPTKNYTVKDTSIGGRISYAYTKNFKLLVDAGTTSRAYDNNNPTQRLNKITIAPTLAVGSDFWSRPELRFYVTRANWNDAAAAANLGTGAAPGFASTNGTAATTLKSQTLAGVQYEIWF